MEINSTLRAKELILGTIFVWLTIFYSPDSVAMSTCQSLFLSPQIGNLKSNQGQEVLMKEYDTIIETVESTFAQLPNGQKGVVIHKSYIAGNPLLHFGYETLGSVHVTRFEKRNLIDEPLPYSDWLKDYVTPSISLVIDAYKNRRSWSGEFRKLLETQAIKYASQSTYIEFYMSPPTKSKIKTSKLQGTLKIVEARQDHSEILPVEENLNIKLPFNGNVKFETANFAIQKEFNESAISEIFFHWMLHSVELMKDTQVNPHQLTYFTYADAISFRMYKGLGFSIPLGFEKTIKKDGVEWTLMGISPAQVLNIPTAMKKSRSHWNEDILKKMDTVFERIQDKKIIAPEYRWQVKSGEIVELLSSKRIDLDSYTNLIIPKEIEAALRKQVVSKYPMLVINLQESTVIIPFFSTTLTLLEDMSGSYYGNKFHYKYKNGKLEIRGKVLEKQILIVLSVDPHFRSIEDIKVRTSNL